MKITRILFLAALFTSHPALSQSRHGGGVGDIPTMVRAADNRFIAWREHLIDDEALSGIELRGSDGLEMADLDGDVDFVGTRGNSGPFDGVFWLEQVRSDEQLTRFTRARDSESPEYPAPVQ